MRANLKEYFTFTTKTAPTTIYTMRPDHLNRTAIFNANGNQIVTGGFRCALWLLRNRPEIVSLWNGNQLEGTLCFA